MKKLQGYIGIAIAVLCATFLFAPVESSILFYSKNVQITPLDRLPASYIIRYLDHNYDIYNSAQKYRACQRANRNTCEIVFSNFKSAYELLLNQSKDLQDYAFNRYITKNNSLDSMFYAKLAAAAVSYSTSKIKSRIAAEIYVINLFTIILIFTLIFLRKAIGKMVIYPVLLAYKLTLSTTRKVHEKI